jgi:hypothetical protein
MRPPEEVMRDYDARARAGSNLLADGGFETSEPSIPGNWIPDGNAGLLQDNAQAEQGYNCYRIAYGGSLSQRVVLPITIRSLRLNISLRNTAGNDQRLNWSIVFRGFEINPKTTPTESWAEDIELHSASGEFRVGNGWKRYAGNTIEVPSQARYAVLYFTGGTQASTTLVDSVSLEPQP